MVIYNLYFRILYNDMLSRMNRYNEILEIRNTEERMGRERKFIEEETEVIGNYLKKEKQIRKRLKEGLNKQYRDIKDKSGRSSFKKIRNQNLDKFDRIIGLGKKTHKYLKKI